nr:hypothetical protein [Candidatus Sigynarchaeota archaeon]
MPSGIRVLRKIMGIGLIIINSLLSLTSFLAVYSAVYFATNSNNYRIDIADPVAGQLNNSVGNVYLYVGNVTLNNTGLFDFNDFRIEFKMYEEFPAYNDSLMNYTGGFGDIPAGTQRTLVMNFTTTTDISNFTVKDNLDYLAVNFTNVWGSLKLHGKYTFSLFDFDLTVRNISQWFV